MFFFFKQKTAYEVRISDWSSDVCSSDLPADSPAGSRDSGPATAPVPRREAWRPWGASAWSARRGWRRRTRARRHAGGRRDRKSVVEGTRVSGRVELGGPRRFNNKKKTTTSLNRRTE